MINNVSASTAASQWPQQATTQPAVHHKHKSEQKPDSVQLSPEAQKAAQAAQNAGKK